ncbi:MAG: hypothetical protein Q9227_008174 [Pyrenula ochraceoflavens]
MLPTAKQYLISGGYSPKAASFALIGLFLGGALGIQILSRAMHHFIPSHIVDCDHTHEEDLESGDRGLDNHYHEGQNHTRNGFLKGSGHRDGKNDERRPLLSTTSSHEALRSISEPADPDNTISENRTAIPPSRRPSLFPIGLTRTLTALTTAKNTACDETGPCMGFSDPCGQECFHTASRRGSTIPQFARAPTFTRIRTATNVPFRIASPVLEDEDEHLHDSAMSESTKSDHEDATGRSRASTKGYSPLAHRSRSSTHHYHHPPHEHPYANGKPRQPSELFRSSEDNDDYVKSQQFKSYSIDSSQEAHHHHVPSNAFMSIGVQTSIAIALHKIPEGFITYATNHANPTLGFAVFMALFIHNITEGFALALPLYLALQSRIKAIIWASILGGVSQPLGAGIAALWFKIANGEGPMAEPGERVYGGMFAVTSGVMTSVAFQLFSESLGLTHNKNLCIGFAFFGIFILGFSSALTA